jgi:hypothetical protein
MESSLAADARSSRRPLSAYLGIPAVALVLFVLYAALDLRAGGPHATIGTTNLTTWGGLYKMVGPAYVVGALVLDAAIAITTAVLLTTSWLAIRRRRAEGSLAACSASTTILIGLAFFTCPMCTVPIVGTLGLTFASMSLPLFGLEFKVVALVVALGTLLWLRSRGTLRYTARPEPA